jgi:regulator of protease activity HflC (stomatin/prohibitin superfamily)
VEKGLAKSDSNPIEVEVTAYALIQQWFRRKAMLLTILMLIVAMIVVFFWNSIVITIRPGQAGILFGRFSGTNIDHVYGEGLHVFNPLDTLYIYEMRKQIAFHEFDVISIKGLTIHISLAIRYRPEYELLGILHQSIGPDYLDRVIIPQIESVMRKQLGNYTAEEIYTNEKGLLTQAILTALEEVGRNYVEVEDIIIRSISLPPDLVKSIEEKLQQEEVLKSYEFRIQTADKEAQRLKIEAQGINNYQKIIGESLTEAILLNKGIEATQDLSRSNNAKIVVIGSGKNGLPIILGNDQASVSTNNKSSKDKEHTLAPAKILPSATTVDSKASALKDDKK